MDHGSLGEEAVSRPGLLFDHRHHAQDQSPHPRPQQQYLDDFGEPEPQVIPVNPYAAANLHAYAANVHPGNSSNSLDDSVDPDDFYRSYRGVHTGNAASPVKDHMAPAVSSPRQTSSLRSNGNGTAPKHPSNPTHRNALRPSHRSTSDPVDDRLGSSGSAAGNGHSASGAFAPSVKDLKKKFDLSSPSPSSSPSSSSSSPQSASTARKATSRTARDTAPGRVHGRSSSVKTTTARDGGHELRSRSGAREAQRSKPATGSQPSSNSRSFASRVARPRANSSANSPAPRSTTQRSSGTPSESQSSQPLSPRQGGLLFGEILPDDNDSVTAGFGINNVRRRRTSESNLHNPARSLVRTLSDPDAEPPSPTDWYRAADLSARQGQEQHTPALPRSHGRAHSDLAGSKLTLKRIDYSAKMHDTGSPLSPASPASPSSRLPIMVKKMSDSSGRDSPLSTRSNSPSTLKYTSASGRSSRQHVSSASRSKTPTGHPATRTGTSSHIPTSSRKPPPPNISTQSSGRLNAYVSVPAPKLSPSLRSSRPRQSVATATTAASRMRAVERGSSPLRQSQRANQKADEPTPRRRKLSVGPIDFAQRRETIKLAYSKSIRESQAKEARQAAAEKRKKELAAVARAKAEAEAVTAAAVANATAVTTLSRQGTGDSRRLSEKAILNEGAGPEESQKATDESPTLQQPTEHQPAEDTHPPLESLTLDIPGSFPIAGTPPFDRDEIPLSAISTTTAVTEFDTEVQTELPGQDDSTAALGDVSGAIIPSLSQVPAEPQIPEQQLTEEPAAPALQKKASYRSPFDDEDDGDDSVSIKISLDTSLQPQISPQLTPTRANFDPLTIPSPAEDDEYVPRPYTFSSTKYETTVRILGPENDFKPLQKDPPSTTTPSSDSPRADEPPASNDHETIISLGPPTNDIHFEEPRIGIEQLSRPEDFYVGPRLRDNIAALRDSTFTSSDPGTPLEDEATPAEYQRTPEVSHSLTVPALLAPANRLSQHSAWTDFSLGSDDGNAALPTATSHSRESDAHERTSLGVAHSACGLSTCDSSLEELTQSPGVSPLDTSGAPSPPMLPKSPGSQHNLAVAGTIGAFPISHESLPGSIAPAPERDPPDPPPSVEAYDQDSAVYNERSRPSSYLYDHDEQGLPTDSMRPSESASQHQLDSLEPSSVSLGDTLVEKPVPPTEEEQEEQKRLRQRQLVIRELIDTEDAFVRDMSVVEEIYKGTAEACPNLDGKTIKLIFRNTDEIIAFHAALLVEFKEGASTVYTPKGRRSPLLTAQSKDSDSVTLNSVVSSTRPDRDDEKDRLTSLGPVFSKNIEQLKAVHEVYLRSSDSSSKRLVQIQEDKTVMLWLNECNEVAKELTSAWNLDSLLIKPMQRITKYPDIITHLLKYTPENHPDRESLITARTAVMDAIDEINKTKKNFELVGQIVSNRKRKESDVRAGLARAFGKRVDKLQVSGTKTAEDEEYQKLQQQFGDDYLRLQVVLRDVEYYTRNVSSYVHEFLQYLSSMELVMRLQPSRDYAHLESKWVQFNVSMRDIEKIALEKHLSDVRKHVIEPFEQVIRCYGNPSLAMKKRAKRRLDYERFVQLKANGKKVDKQLAELVEQYEALNDTLKKELPKLSAMTAEIGNICLGKFISIQAVWFLTWKEKVKAPLQDVAHVPELSEIVSTFQREFALQDERAKALGILNPTLKSRASQSTTDDASSTLSRTKSRPSDLVPSRGRGLSINSDHIPTLPTPDFVKRNSGQFSLSPASSALPSPAHYYRDYYSGINGHHARGGSGSPVTPDPNSTNNNSASRSATLPVRPSTGRSFDSLPRQSSESTPALSTYSMSMTGTMGAASRRNSNSTFNSSYLPPGPGGSASGASEQQQQQQQQQTTRRLSGLFHSALPLPDGAAGGGGGGGPEERSLRSSSRASSQERGGTYKVLWLAASLFEFNIETTKHEAGYPYLTYQAGEIFDVIAEKGELWLAKNQDDPRDVVGWIWSKHFAKLADS